MTQDVVDVLKAVAMRSVRSQSSPQPDDLVIGTRQAIGDDSTGASKCGGSAGGASLFENGTYDPTVVAQAAVVAYLYLGDAGLSALFEGMTFVGAGGASSGCDASFLNYAGFTIYSGEDGYLTLKPPHVSMGDTWVSSRVKFSDLLKTIDMHKMSRYGCCNTNVLVSSSVDAAVAMLHTTLSDENLLTYSAVGKSRILVVNGAPPDSGRFQFTARKDQAWVMIGGSGSIYISNLCGDTGCCIKVYALSESVDTQIVPANGHSIIGDCLYLAFGGKCRSALFLTLIRGGIFRYQDDRASTMENIYTSVSGCEGERVLQRKVRGLPDCGSASSIGGRPLDKLYHMLPLLRMFLMASGTRADVILAPRKQVEEVAASLAYNPSAIDTNAGSLPSLGTLLSRWLTVEDADQCISGKVLFKGLPTGEKGVSILVPGVEDMNLRSFWESAGPIAYTMQLNADGEGKPLRACVYINDDGSLTNVRKRDDCVPAWLRTRASYDCQSMLDGYATLDAALGLVMLGIVTVLSVVYDTGSFHFLYALSMVSVLREELESVLVLKGLGFANDVNPGARVRGDQFVFSFTLFLGLCEAIDDLAHEALIYVTLVVGVINAAMLICAYVGHVRLSSSGNMEPEDLSVFLTGGYGLLTSTALVAGVRCGGNGRLYCGTLSITDKKGVLRGRGHGLVAHTNVEGLCWWANGCDVGRSDIIEHSIGRVI